MIISKTASKTGGKGTDFYQYSSTLPWNLIKQDFLNSAVVREIFIQADDPTECFQEFLSFFQSIEAAGGLVFNPRGEFVVIEKYNRWDLPKGKVEPGETPAQAAVREVREECGLKQVQVVKSLPKTYHVYFQDYQWFLKTNFWFEMETDEYQLTPQAEEQISQIFWLPFEERALFCSKTYPSVKRLVENIIPRKFKTTR